MRWLKFVLSFSATLLLLWVLNRPAGKITFRPLAFFSPYEGFWGNAEPKETAFSQKEILHGLTAPVKVVIDEARVPHIFAENTEDAAYMQGFVTARDRLWQMEFQTMAADGRLSRPPRPIIAPSRRLTRRSLRVPKPAGPNPMELCWPSRSV